MEVGETSIVSKPVFSQGYAINTSLSGAPIWSGFGPKIRVTFLSFLPSALEMKNFLKLRNQFGFCFFFPFFFFQILWMRGKFTACLAYRQNHRYNIYGFDQWLELCTCGAIKFIEKFLYTVTLKLYFIIFLKLNFVPNLHYKDVNVTPRYKFVYSSH